jgi:LysM repeat protein
MSHRSPSRWLAPVALVAFALAVFVIVGSNPSKGDGSSARPAETTQTSRDEGTGGSSGATDAAATTPKKTQEPARRSYSVVPGDTLSAIAVKTGVALEDLQRFNPDLDSQALQTGQKVNLEP